MTLRPTIFALFIWYAFALPSQADAQKPVWPSDLDQAAHVEQILTWLDQTTFSKAHIRLKDTWDAKTYRPPWSDSRAASQTFVFSDGFKMRVMNGCTVVLTNNDVKMLSDSMKFEIPSKRLTADVILELHRMSATKGRKTYRYTRNSEAVRVLGGWRTELSYRGFVNRTMVGLHLYYGDPDDPALWEGFNVAFIFESKEMSEQFDATFRRAIKLCQQK